MKPIGPISYTYYPYSFLTVQILEKCSTLFNDNYGVWSDEAPLQSNNALKAGSRVKLGIKRLREMMLFNENCFLVTAELHSMDNHQVQHIGHAFCSSAKYDRLNGNLVWISQLVVSSSYRGRGVAGNLLSVAKNQVEDAVVAGLVSSNPYAIKALANACNRTPVDLDFIKDHAEDIIRASGVPYLTDVPLVGSIFDEKAQDNADKNQKPVSLVKTNFFVDHKGVLAILNGLGEKWNLGPPLEGHEFLAVFPTTSVHRSRDRK